MQLCPALRKRPRAAMAATRGRSASARTTNGSEPPSSSTDFLIASPAAAPTARPGPLAAGDGDGADAGILDQPPGDGRDVRLGDHEGGEQPLRRAGLGQDIRSPPARSRWCSASA